MTNDKRKKQIDLYNNSVETKSMKDIDIQRQSVENKFMERRKTYAEEYSVLIQSLINTMIMEFNTMFPGAEGFIEGRIKSNNSIALKLKNKFQKAINEKDKSKAISEVDLTDILACSVVVTVPPKRFRTTDDKLNDKLNDLVKGLETSGERLKEHNKYIEDNEEQVAKLNEDIDALKQKKNCVMKNGISQDVIQMFTEYYKKHELQELQIDELKGILATLELKSLQEATNTKNAQKELAEENIKYGQQNLSRTQETYDKELLELQREMAYYFVSNLAKCQSFKILNTKQTEQPEMKNKPGFVAITSKYTSVFTNSKTNDKYEIGFEIQGKGEEDWKLAEFGKGASYHENQKSDEGQYSKQTYLPDFTIIGKKNTSEIEENVRSEYAKLDFAELAKKNKLDLEQWITENSKFDTELIISELDKVKKYVRKIQEKQDKPIIITVDDQKKIIEKDTDEYERYHDIIEKVAENKINEAYESAHEYIVKKEIEKRINEKIDKKADEQTFIKRVEDKKSPLNSIYTKEIEKLLARDNINSDMITNEMKHECRVKVLYYIKEQEIREISKDIVPIYFWANISDNKDENSMIYYRSTGEAIYRYYYNRLNGLRKGDGYEENFEPQEQQKIALLKLAGLFEEDETNFFVYDKKRNARIDLSDSVPKKEDDKGER